MPRTTYRNGDPITLGNCNGCQVARINGVLSHEHGCPDAWRDYVRDCRECGREFQPETRHQGRCGGCCKEALHA